MAAVQNSPADLLNAACKKIQLRIKRKIFLPCIDFGKKRISVVGFKKQFCTEIFGKASCKRGLADADNARYGNQLRHIGVNDKISAVKP